MLWVRGSVGFGSGKLVVPWGGVWGPSMAIYGDVWACFCFVQRCYGLLRKCFDSMEEK